MTDQISSVDINSLVDELMVTATEAHSGRATHVFRASRHGVMSQVLLVLKQGRELSEHENPGEALLYVLQGRVRLIAGEDSWEMGSAEHLVIPQQRHSLLALEDSAVFLTVAHSAA